jgi:hypothetical protein
MLVIKVQVPWLTACSHMLLVRCIIHREQCIIVGDSNMFKKKRAGALWASVVHHYCTTGAKSLV